MRYVLAYIALLERSLLLPKHISFAIPPLGSNIPSLQLFPFPIQISTCTELAILKLPRGLLSLEIYGKMMLHVNPRQSLPCHPLLYLPSRITPVALCLLRPPYCGLFFFDIVLTEQHGYYCWT